MANKLPGFDNPLEDMYQDVLGRTTNLVLGTFPKDKRREVMSQWIASLSKTLIAEGVPALELAHLLVTFALLATGNELGESVADFKAGMDRLANQFVKEFSDG